MRNNENYALAIDAGGTYFKSSIIGSGGSMLEEHVKKTPVDSAGDSENILRAYETIIKESFAYAKKRGIQIAGIGISTPGPFDYDGYKSLMRHKFLSIYGINLRDEFIKRGAIPVDLPVKFLHDVHAFVLGEHWNGAAKGFSRVVSVTIGTGVGFGCIIDNKIRHNGSGGPYVSLFRQSCRGTLLEDAVSKRGIIKTYCELSGTVASSGMDAKEIGLLAEMGSDMHAVMTYRRVGGILAEMLSGILEELAIECLVLGGQISRSFSVMEEDLKQGLKGVKGLKKICMAEDIDGSPLIGAAKAVFETEIEETCK